MAFLYYLGVKIYAQAIKIAALFNSKARLRSQGAKNAFDKLKKFKAQNVIWFHCASLGEFEQGRPLIEKIKNRYPNYQIALSFFSPSGYEVRKNYNYADLVFYLPDDSPKNAAKVIDLLKPEIVFFVKYEFWYYYLKELRDRRVSVYLVSGIFRKNQIFFRYYGKFFLNIIKLFEHLFVQNSETKKLLSDYDIRRVSVTGDTRFDRVFENSVRKQKIPLIEIFRQNKFIFIAGSTWKPDEEIIFDFINNSSNPTIKYIIAPHEIHDNNIIRILRMTKKNIIRFSQANEQNVAEAEILLIDNIGMLSSLYAYGDIAYVGGGFGAGIHNTLEAAVFGIPVIFGPNYQKFDEAEELIKREAGFTISGKNDFNNLLQKLISDKNYRKLCGKNADTFVKENIGATEKIMKMIREFQEM